MRRRFSFKQKLGACIYDLPRFLWATKPEVFRREKVPSWVFLRNRSERLIPATNGMGVQCDWQWCSNLHIADVFPVLGRLALKRVIRDCPVMFQKEPNTQNGPPQVSFIIGHRGMQRLPHLLLTLQSVAAQSDVSIECVVVEQSSAPEVKDHLPSWVRYIHTPLPYADMPYCRSWALNVGACSADGNLLVLHDNDMLLPKEYASQLVALAEDGYEVMNLKRFVFYLTESHSIGILAGQCSLFDDSPDSVVQNLEGGGSIAITRDAYFALGGFDEAFVGWGGEDNEFWERAQTRRLWPYGYLPLIHLWHPAQPGKLDNTRLTATLFEARSRIPAAERIAELTSREFGNPQSALVKPTANEASLLSA